MSQPPSHPVMSAAALAFAFPPSLGYKGARTTIADIAHHRARGFLCRNEALTFARDVMILGNANLAQGGGNRWRRRWTALVKSRMAAK